MSGGLTRRDLVIGLVIAGTGVVIGSRPALATSLTGQVTTEVTASPGRMMRRSAFAKSIGQSFQVCCQNVRPFILVLDSVRDLSPQARGASDQFVLRFAGGNAVVGQGAYEFRNRRLGRFDLFVVPMMTASGTAYEAVVNRA